MGADRILYFARMARKVSLWVLAGGLLWAQKLATRTWGELRAAMAQHPDTLYVLNFWATWCRPCVAELPYLQAAAERLSDSLPVRIWLVSLEFPPDGPQVAAAVLRRKGITLPAFWLSETDPNAWIPQLNPNWDGAIPYTQAGLQGPSHGAFPDTESVVKFVKKAYATRTPTR